MKYVIIGHSERRQYFNETDEACNKKVLVALENGLRPILCVGESLTEREQDVTMEVIRKQIKIALQGVAVEDIKKVVIAYEPIWAIGTGKTATAEQAGEVCGAIRDCPAREVWRTCSSRHHHPVRWFDERQERSRAAGSAGC